jgi:hypothetical protein
MKKNISETSNSFFSFSAPSLLSKNSAAFTSDVCVSLLCLPVSEKPHRRLCPASLMFLDTAACFIVRILTLLTQIRVTQGRTYCLSKSLWPVRLSFLLKATIMS